MQFGQDNAPKFFLSEDEDENSSDNQLDIYERVDQWLLSQEVYEMDPANIVDEMFDDIRRKTFSEFSSMRNEGQSVNNHEASPFFLTSP